MDQGAPAPTKYRSIRAALDARDAGELLAPQVEIDVRNGPEGGAFRIRDGDGHLRLELRPWLAFVQLLRLRGFRRVRWSGLEVGR